MPRAINFNAGPASLPLPALERAQAELIDFAASGMSVMEHSHRGKEYEAVHGEALSLVRELLEVPADYDVLFMQGGATQQFATIPLSFIPTGKSADYVVNGAWGAKAVSEGKLAAALVALSDSGELPLRFVAGGDAMAAVEANLKTIQTQIDALRELSSSLNHV